MDRPLLPVQWASPPSPPDSPWVNNRHLGSLALTNKCSGLAQGLRGPDPPGGPFPCQATMGAHPRLFYPHTTHTRADSAIGRLRLPVTWQGWCCPKVGRALDPPPGSHTPCSAWHGVVVGFCCCPRDMAPLCWVSGWLSTTLGIMCAISHIEMTQAPWERTEVLPVVGRCVTQDSLQQWEMHVVLTHTPQGPQVSVCCCPLAAV